jgi:hypothetical protein
VTEDECKAAINIFEGLFPYIVTKVKDSFCNTLVAGGVPISGEISVGEAFVVKKSRILKGLKKVGILVINRPGSIFYREPDSKPSESMI